MIPILNLLTQYTGTGARIYFEYGFELFPEQTVLVLVNGVPVAFVRQDLGVVIEPAPPLNATILIYRQTDVTQLEDYQPFESFDAAKTEWSCDKLIMLKQEALIYRAQLNLYSDPLVDRVILVNDKGTDAVIYLWDQDEAGMFAGKVGELPNVGSFVAKPENFAYFNCAGGEEPPPPFADYEYFIYLDETNYRIRYFGVDFDTGLDLEFGSYPHPSPSDNSITSDDTFVFTPFTITSVGQYIWRGHAFSHVFNGLHGGPNGIGYMLHLGGSDHEVLLVTTEAFGHGMRALTHVTGSPYSFPTSAGYTAVEDTWGVIFDLRFGNPGEPAYGDAIVLCPFGNGDRMTTYQKVAGTWTLISQVDVPGEFSLATSAYYGWDRDSGFVTRKFNSQLYFDLYQVNMTTLALSSIGRCEPTTNFVLAAGITPNGLIITLEDTGGAQDAIRIYSRAGLVLTLLDTYLITGATNANAQIRTSPYTQRIWVMTHTATAGSYALEVDEFGTIDVQYVTDKAMNSGGGGSNPIHFLSGPMHITTNGFVGIKQKLYECWQMNEVGSITRVGAMGKLNLPVAGTVSNRAGLIGNAAEFIDGSSGLMVATPIELAGIGTFSFCCDVWFDSKTGVNQQVLGINFSNATVFPSGQEDWGVRFDHATSRLQVYVVVGSTLYTVAATDAGNPATGTWHHMYGEYNADDHEIKIRVNGGTLYTTAVTGRKNETGTHLQVGRMAAAGGLLWPLDGAVDGLYLFWDALTAAEQDFMYNSGASRAFSEL